MYSNTVTLDARFVSLIKSFGDKIANSKRRRTKSSKAWLLYLKYKKFPIINIAVVDRKPTYSNNNRSSFSKQVLTSLPTKAQTSLPTPAQVLTSLSTPTQVLTSLYVTYQVLTSLYALLKVLRSLSTPTYVLTSLPTPTQVMTSLSTPT